MPTMIAVDPGDVYVGVAFFEPAENEWGWECVDAQEFEPDAFLDTFGETVMGNDLGICVFERYRLYEDKSAMQKGSEFPTAQMIGAMKFIVRRHNEHCYLHTEVALSGKMLSCELQGMSCADPNIWWQAVDMIGQFADIMKPTTGILRHKGIKSTAKPIDRKLYGGRGHVVAAELHGWHYILEGAVSGKQSVHYFDV